MKLTGDPGVRAVALMHAADLVKAHPHLMMTAKEINEDVSGDQVIVRVAEIFRAYLEGGSDEQKA